MINKKGIKIADFGLAKKLRQYNTSRVCTAWYKAPELILGFKNYTTKIDIWSLGCVAIQMILGHHFLSDQETESQILFKIF